MNSVYVLTLNVVYESNALIGVFSSPANVLDYCESIVEITGDDWESHNDEGDTILWTIPHNDQGDATFTITEYPVDPKPRTNQQSEYERGLAEGYKKAMDEVRYDV
jgi:hypothetical protein